MKRLGLVFIQRSVLFCATLSMIPAPTLRAQLGKITVGANVHVSADRPQMIHNEVLMAADPTNPDRLLACPFALPLSDIQNPDRPHLGYAEVYLSEDAGKSWRLVTEMSPAGGVGNNDVHCGFGIHGEIFLVSAFDNPVSIDDSREGGGGKCYGVIRRSTDGGKTWSEDEALPQGWTLDRQFIIVDDSGGKYNGRLYIGGNGSIYNTERDALPALFFWRSLDNGVTWDRPITLTGKRSGGSLNSWNTAILPDGTAVFAYGDNSDYPNYEIKLLLSKDGGETLSKALPVANGTVYNPVTVTADRSNGPFRGRLYVGWPGKVGDRVQLLVTRSDDQGKTWSEPVAVADAPAAKEMGLNAISTPAITVNKDGVVGATWNDRRGTRDNKGYWPSFSASLDGGETWSQGVRMSAEPKRFLQGERVTIEGGNGDLWTGKPASPRADPMAAVTVNWKEWDEGGHLSGLAADGHGTFQAVWIDNRTGIHQAWGSSITVSGSVTRNGGSELADYRDVSAKTELELAGVQYDESSHRVIVAIRIRNTSDQTLSGAVKLRLIAARSDVANVSATDAINKMTGPGAVWDLTDLMPTGGLAPGKESAEKQLVFLLSEVQSLKGLPPEYGTAILKLKARILAK
jgi:hypothetical protein